MLHSLLAILGAIPQALFPACLTCCAPAEVCRPIAVWGGGVCGVPCSSPCAVPKENSVVRCGIASTIADCCLEPCKTCRCFVPLAVLPMRDAALQPWVPTWSGLLVPSIHLAPMLIGHDRTHHEVIRLCHELVTHNQRQSLLSVWTK